MAKYTKRVEIAGKSADELFAKTSAQIGQYLEKLSIDSSALTPDPTKRQITIKSKMFNGVLSCTDGALELNADLSLFAMPFKAKIDEGIDRWIKKTFQT